MRFDTPDDCFGLNPVGPGPSAVVNAVDTLKTNGHVIRYWRGERDKTRVVVVDIAEGDKTFVAAAVVPLKAQPIHACTQAFVQDAFKVLHLLFTAPVRIG